MIPPKRRAYVLDYLKQCKEDHQQMVENEYHRQRFLVTQVIADNYPLGPLYKTNCSRIQSRRVLMI